MSRRIVFVGGVQTRALARIYRGEIAGPAGEDVVFIGTGAVGTDAARSTLLLADAVVMEIDEDGDAIPPADQPARADMVRVPNLYCDFLWPFAGRAHPQNRGAFSLPGGPYPAEHGDRFLDQMMAEGVDEDSAIRRYLGLNMAAEGELDSRLADRLEIMTRLDRIGGYDLAGYVRDRFREECLFRTRQRMTMPLLRRLVGQMLPKLGVRDWHEDRLKRVPFPAGAQPVHPGVIRHFGLTWTIPQAEYPLNDEGYFTFPEFCRRYMRFAWNEALHRGIQAAATRPAEALPDLESGLAACPDSALGRRALLLARRALGLEPDTGESLIVDEDSYDPAEEAASQPSDVPPAAEIAAALTPPDAAPLDVTTPEAAEPEPEPEPEEVSAAEPEDLAPQRQAATPAMEQPPAPEAEPEPAPVEPASIRATPIAAAPPSSPSPVVAEPAAEPAPTLRKPVPAKPANLPEPERGATLVPASPGDGFTDFRPAAADAGEDVIATPGADLIEVLPQLLPVFKDLSGAVDRPFHDMPEILPPPPLRPILPPELQGEPVKQGLFARLLGRK